ICLPDYSRANRICGVDISEPMLQKARERVAALAMTNVEGLWVMDAEHLAFPDESFDVVVAQYVVTTVPNPEATLDEFARVLKPGGEIVLVSRVGAEAGLRRALEKWFAPAARKLGWRTEFSWQRYADWADRTDDMRLAERRAMPPLGHFALIRFAKRGKSALHRRDPPVVRASLVFNGKVFKGNWERVPLQRLFFCVMYLPQNRNINEGLAWNGENHEGLP